MEKRTLLAVLLILVVFWISSEFIWKSKKTQVEKPATEIIEKPEVQVEVKPTKEITTQIPVEPESDIEIADDITLENEFLKVSFSNQGAVVNSIQLKEYFLSDKETSVELIPNNESLLNTELLMSSGNILNLKNIIFQFIENKEDNQITFISQTEAGIIEKTYKLTGKYQVDLEMRITSYEDFVGYNIGLDSGIADTEEYLKMKSREYKVVGQLDNAITKYSLAKLKENRELSGNIDWAAIKSKYFTMAIIPDDLIDMNKLSAFKRNESPAMKIGITVSRPEIVHRYRLYFGPLLYSDLKEYGNGIENTVEMGPKFLQWISKIFMAFLKFLHSFIPSWGICVVVFSVVLKIILYPLTHKSFESSTKMQKIQPLMNELKTKYKSDPQRMNAELKKLYKEHGVNPLGGCLPMLLQMPILFALYPILRYSIDLRQAHFLWLPDLSEPDPIWLLPILMAVFMFVQQKLMSPSKQSLEEMDEKQRASMQSQKMMMYFMPIMMFFIFKSLSSGLVLYWTLFSVIGSIQQYIIKKKFKKEEQCAK